MTQTPRAQDELYRSPVETAIDLAREALDAKEAALGEPISEFDGNEWTERGEALEAVEQTTRNASSIRKEASSMNKNELGVAEEAWVELVAAVQQMAPADDQIICNHVRRAEGLLRALVMIRKEQGGPK